MDIELFQWVLLGLLALGVIVLLALLSTLGGIKKALEQRSSGGATELSSEPRGHAAEPDVTGGHETTTDETAGSELGTYPPSEQAATPAASSGRADTIRSVLQQHGLGSEEQPSATQQPAAAQEPAVTQPEETGVVDSVFAAHADDPQEEPFQRDGRWWFRRGDELLLYDETSGQWQPAPDDPSVPATVGATGSTGDPAAEPGVQTTPVSTTPATADQVATFWKCPTCGAVNGSTAATCRMCFAARP